MNHFKQTLVELLNIQGQSGQEHRVAAYVTDKLKKFQYEVHMDSYGNVLTEKTYGTGPILYCQLIWIQFFLLLCIDSSFGKGTCFEALMALYQV